jgi:hypothetical protein
LLNPLADVLPLNRATVASFLGIENGGTNLGSSRTNPFRQMTEEGTHQESIWEVTREYQTTSARCDSLRAVVKTRSAYASKLA